MGENFDNVTFLQMDEAVEAIKEAISRVPSRLPWAGVREQIDIATALMQIGASSAHREVDRAVEMARNAGLLMYELEALELRRRFDSADVVVNRMEAIRAKLALLLSEPECFVRRWT